jgi:predicted transcriptional regulator
MAKRKEIMNKSEMVALHNSITNEMEFAKVSVRVEKDMPKYKNEPFVILFQVANSLLIGDMQLIDCKVVLYMMSKSQYGNVIDRTIKEMAEEMKVKDSNYVQKSLKRLVEMKIVLARKHPSDNRRFIYMLNPKQSWKGTVKDRQKTMGFFNPKQLQMPFDEEPKEQSIKQSLPNNFDFFNE